MWEFNFFHIFGIPSSSRHEKCGQMLETLFWLLQCSKNPRWLATPKFVTVLLIDISELPHSIVIYLRKKKVLRKILFSYLSSGVKWIPKFVVVKTPLAGYPKYQFKHFDVLDHPFSSGNILINNNRYRNANPRGKCPQSLQGRSCKWYKHLYNYFG